MSRLCLGCFCVLLALNSYSWNAMGHRLVAQIAYNHLTPQARKQCKLYLDVSGKGSFVEASTWMDRLKSRGIHDFDVLHYMDIPFSSDGTILPQVHQKNALWGIRQAISVLESKESTNHDKGVSLRILIHIIGDIHQPLHTSTLVSARFPGGDLGGNLFRLGKNSVAVSLHQYWDRGAGSFPRKRTPSKIRKKARQFETKWSCEQASSNENPKTWIKSSHDLALTDAYAISPGATPNKYYQVNAQNKAQQQIVFAGCRLALLLNHII